MSEETGERRFDAAVAKYMGPTHPVPIIAERVGIEDRFERAQEREIEFFEVNEDPLVIEADSEHSGRTHTLVPAAMHCSCEDHTYRGPVCYHLAALLADDEYGEITRDALDDQIDTTAREFGQIREQIESVYTDLVALRDVQRRLTDHTDTPVFMPGQDVSESGEDSELGDGPALSDVSESGEDAELEDQIEWVDPEGPEVPEYPEDSEYPECIDTTDPETSEETTVQDIAGSLSGDGRQSSVGHDQTESLGGGDR